MNFSLDDISTFYYVIQEGGFSHAAKILGVSNGLITRRIKQLESKLGVSLIKRTTRQLKLTPEGDLLWEHAQRVHQELDSAFSLIKTSATKPKGIIYISAPPYFGRQYLTSILMKFLDNYKDIQINLNLGNQDFDLIKEKHDLIIRGFGYYVEDKFMKDINLNGRLLIKEKIGIYAAPSYLSQYGEPQTINELSSRTIVNHLASKQFGEDTKWKFFHNNKKGILKIKSSFCCNDIESSLFACITGRGIGRFTDLNVKSALYNGQLRPILTEFDWGNYYLYALYSKQQALPKRTRLLLDFISADIKEWN